MRKIVLAVMVFMFFLTSCTQPENVEQICISRNGAYSDNRIYFTVGGLNMRYFSTAVWKENYLCSDPLCNHNNIDCTSYIGGFGTTQVAASDGMVYTVTLDGPSGSIISLDIAENKRTYLVKNYPNSIGRFLVCSNGTYFCSGDGEGNQHIWFAEEDDEYSCMTEDMKGVFVLMCAENNKIWFHDQLGGIYCADPKFETIERICTLENTDTKGFHLIDGWLYWYGDCGTVTVTEDSKTYTDESWTLYRMRIPEYGERETVISGVHSSSSMIFTADDIWVTASNLTVEDGWQNNSGGKLYHIDAHTLETEEIIIPGTDFGTLAYAGEDYICGFGKYWNETKLNMGYIIYDRADGKLACVKA